MPAWSTPPWATGDSGRHQAHHAQARELGQAIADPEDREIFFKTFDGLPVPEPGCHRNHRRSCRERQRRSPLVHHPRGSLATAWDGGGGPSEVVAPGRGTIETPAEAYLRLSCYGDRRGMVESSLPVPDRNAVGRRRRKKSGPEGPDLDEFQAGLDLTGRAPSSLPVGLSRPPGWPRGSTTLRRRPTRRRAPDASSATGRRPLRSVLCAS